LLVLFLALAALGACGAPSLRPTPALPEQPTLVVAAAPTVQPEADCISEEQLNSGQIEAASLQGLDSYCFVMLSGEIVTIDQRGADESVRAFAEAPDASLTFEGIGASLNAPEPLRVAAFRDNVDSKYRLDLNTWRVVEAELRRERRAETTLPLDELRSRAEAIVLRNTPEFASMRERLTYEEDNKTDMFFFRWEDRTYQGWQVMPPLAVLGLSADGRLVTYVNSLFLAAE
jgi:hypothetical protein